MTEQYDIEYKAIPVDMKVSSEKGKFSGLAAVFGNIDFGGDIIVKGAFEKSLADQTASGKTIPILWQHDWSEPLGHWTDLHENSKGLYGEGLLLTDTDPLALKAYGLIKAGSISGLSIGYRPVEVEYNDQKDARLLKEVDLLEVSVVTFPMNDAARIDAVKAAALTKRELEHLLTREARLSRSVAHALMDGGYDAIQAKRDAGENGEKQMVKILDEILDQLKQPSN